MTTFDRVKTPRISCGSTIGGCAPAIFKIH